MKKVLFCAGLLALVASCAENEYDSAPAQIKKGITFEAVEAENGASTRGGFTPEADGSYTPFWYAEKDKINIFGTMVSGTTGGNTTTEFDNSKVVTYKATQSATRGVFTGVSDADVLNFEVPAGKEETTVSNFVAIYPSGITTAYAVHASAAGDEAYKAKGIFTLSGLGTKLGLAAQDQTDAMGAGIYDKMLKVSVTSAQKKNSYDAVGEKINLNFERQLSGIIFQTKGLDKYADVTGKLKSITFVSKGQRDETYTDKVPAYKASTETAIGLVNAATLTVDLSKEGADRYELTNDGASSDQFTNKLTLDNSGGGMKWSDASKAFMVVAPHAAKTVAEDFVATFEFENLTFTKVISTTAAFKKGDFSKVTLTIDDDNMNSVITTDNKIIIREGGHLKDLIADASNLAWAGNAKVSNTAIIGIDSEVELDASELALLKKFTGLTTIRLTKNTNLAKGTFDNGVAAATSIILPEVTSIADGFIGTAFTALVTLELPKCDINKADGKNGNNIKELFFNDNTKSHLVTVDVSGVSNMVGDITTSGNVSFEGYAALETVTVKDGVTIPKKAFKGCKALKEVKGTIDIANAESAFEMTDNTSNKNDVLTTINIKGTDIPANAFKNCTALVSILKDGAQVAPTKVGANAFENAAAVKYIDLTNTTTLGAEAFKGAKTLAGRAEGASILKVGAKAIPASVFEDCAALTKIQFTAATTIAVNIFKGATNLNSVQFDQVFGVGAITKTSPANATNYWETTFAASSVTSGVTLYVNAAQPATPDKDGNGGVVIGPNGTLTFQWWNSSSVGSELTNADAITFAKIQKLN